MPRALRGLLEELGWQERSWLEYEEPAPLRLKWLDLSYRQRQAALLLGYSEDTWARCPMSPCLDRAAYVRQKFNNIRWGDMKLATQRAWLLLEHSPELWAKGKQPRTRTVRWEELSTEQQRQATFLGHNLGTWQGCNEQWKAPEVPDTNFTLALKSPTRVVRARMTIARPFTDISGNIYGQEVASMPTSFVDIFERSVARALFCGNPPLSPTMQTYVGQDGKPLCIVESAYLRQRNRVKVVTVVEGSIIVEFYIQANQTAEDRTPVELLAMLDTMLSSLTSPLCQDMEFGRFASRAEVEEVPLSIMEYNERVEALAFEKLRG